jgi:hypothetical protein
MAEKPHNSSPPKLTPRGFIQCSVKPVPLAKDRQAQLRKNMEGYFLGPMDPTDFMNAFMPINSQNSGSPPEGIDFSGVYGQKIEKMMYEPFVSCFVLIL